MKTAIMAIKYFDTLEYVKKAKELRDPEALAEYQVEKMESAIETVYQQISMDLTDMRNEMKNNNRELATKADLRYEITISKQELRQEIQDVKLDIQEARQDTVLLKKAFIHDLSNMEHKLWTEIICLKKDTENGFKEIKSGFFMLKKGTENGFFIMKEYINASISELNSRVNVKISELRYDMIKFVVWTGVISVFTLGGLIAHGFHWI